MDATVREKWPVVASFTGASPWRRSAGMDLARGGEAERTREGRREQAGGVVDILASGEVQRSSYPLVGRRRRGGWTATGAHGPARSVEQEATGEGEWAGLAGPVRMARPEGCSLSLSLFLKNSV